MGKKKEILEFFLYTKALFTRNTISSGINLGFFEKFIHVVLNFLYSVVPPLVGFLKKSSFLPPNVQFFRYVFVVFWAWFWRGEVEVGVWSTVELLTFPAARRVYYAEEKFRGLCIGIHRVSQPIDFDTLVQLSIDANGWHDVCVFFCMVFEKKNRGGLERSHMSTRERRS